MADRRADQLDDKSICMRFCKTISWGLDFQRVFGYFLRSTTHLLWATFCLSYCDCSCPSRDFFCCQISPRTLQRWTSAEMSDEAQRHRHIQCGRHWSFSPDEEAEILRLPVKRRDQRGINEAPSSSFDRKRSILELGLTNDRLLNL
jgi:hypothetical protein